MPEGGGESGGGATEIIRVRVRRPGRETGGGGNGGSQGLARVSAGSRRTAWIQLTPTRQPQPQPQPRGRVPDNVPYNVPGYNFASRASRASS